MNSRMAVFASIASWLARGASPVDGMYWFDTKADAQPKADPSPAPAEARRNEIESLTGVCRA